MLKFLPLLAFVGGSVYAAPSTNPEFLHQAPVGAHELTPKLGYLQTKTKMKPTDSVDVTGFKESVRYEYGLTEMFSAGAELAAHSYKADQSDANAKDTTASGLEDLVIFFHGRSDQDGGSLRYGLDVNFALEKEKRETGGQTNAASGGIGLTPFVGYETAVGQGILGARLKYKLNVTDRKGELSASNGSTVSYNLSGGNVLEPAVFYEMPMGTATLGVAFEMAFNDKSKAEVNGNKTDFSTSGTLWDIGVYVPVDVTPSIRILPQINYGQASAYDTANIDSITLWGLEVGARFVF